MAINLGDNIKIQGNLPIDYRYFNNLVPYTSTGQVDATIPIGERYLGLTVNINNVEYWYANGINNGDLVLKINAGTLNAASNGLSLSGTSVILGGSNLTIPTIIGDSRPIPVGIEYADDYSATFLPNSLITKQYADAVATGVHPKLAVQVATTGNIVLNSGTTSIDNYLLNINDRILVKNQTIDSENGIYIVTGGTWQRSSDFDFSPSGETLQGTLIPVITGNTNGNTLWVLVSPDPVLSGNSITFTLFGTVTLTAGVGINILGSTVSVDGSSLAGNHIDWSGTQFDVNANSIVSGYTTLVDFGNYTGTTQPILNVALTGATNGLNYSNRCVCLGGLLTSDTTISGGGYGFEISGGTSEFIIEPAGITLGFSGQSVSFDTNAGLTYDACYHNTYTDRSLVDKEYVDKMIVSGATGSTLYTGTSPSTIQVGWMAANTSLTGKTISKILQDILVKYIQPTFTTFSVTQTNPVEVGTTISGSKMFSWNFANIGNVSGNSLCIVDVTAGSPLLPININPTILSTGMPIISKTFVNCGDVQQWRGSARPTQGTPNPFLSSNYTLTAILPYYWGVVNAPGPSGSNRPTAAQIVSLISNGSGVGTCNKVLVSSDNISAGNAIDFNSSGSDYMWVAIPSTVSKKLKWCITPSNCGFISGAVNPGGSLFPDPAQEVPTAMGCVVTPSSLPAWSKTYNIYISNKQSENADPMGFIYV